MRNKAGAPVASIMVTAATHQLTPARAASLQKLAAQAAADLERSNAAELG